MTCNFHAKGAQGRSPGEVNGAGAGGNGVAAVGGDVEQRGSTGSEMVERRGLAIDEPSLVSSTHGVLRARVLFRLQPGIHARRVARKLLEQDGQVMLIEPKVVGLFMIRPVTNHAVVEDVVRILKCQVAIPMQKHELAVRGATIKIPVLAAVQRE